MSGPAVHFNIGVCAYRLGQLARAETAFLEAARTPEMSALAHYNLGLVAQRQGEPAAAARWFLRVEQEASDEQLRALAGAQLADTSPPPERNWLGYATLVVGYDDNVALLSGADVLGVSDTSDQFAELQLAANTSIVQSWRFDGSLVLLDYESLNDFDQFSANGGARYRRQLGSWNGDVILQLAYEMLDGDGFQARRMFALQASKVLPGDWRLRTRYRFGSIDGLGEFNGLDGYRHEIDARAAWHHRAWDVAIEYRFDANNYDDATLSLNRHGLGINVQRALTDVWTFEARLALDHTRYDTGSNGSEDRSEWQIAVSRVLNTRWRLVVRYAYADNEAERAEFDYRRKRISAEIEAAL